MGAEGSGEENGEEERERGREAAAGGRGTIERKREKRVKERRSERGTRCGEEECGLQERESVVAKADRSADHPELALRLR